MRARALLMGVALFALVLGCAPARAGGELLIFAAASLQEVIDEVAARFCAQRGCRARVSYAASSTLARQIEQGAPAQVFVSASVQWMDYLDARGLIERGSRVDVAGNTLVLVAPADSTIALRIASGFDLAGALQDGYLAVGDPAYVPAGMYARAALQHLGVWEAVATRLARAANVRAALALVARGETPLGLVYGSDAAAEPRVRVAGVFPAGTHPDIVYPAAAVRADAAADAGAFVRFLAGGEAAALFAQHGFRPAPGAP